MLVSLRVKGLFVCGIQSFSTPSNKFLSSTRGSMGFLFLSLSSNRPGSQNTQQRRCKFAIYNPTCEQKNVSYVFVCKQHVVTRDLPHICRFRLCLIYKEQPRSSPLISYLRCCVFCQEQSTKIPLDQILSFKPERFNFSFAVMLVSTRRA